jgi:hypothetical protein
MIARSPSSAAGTLITALSSPSVAAFLAAAPLNRLFLSSFKAEQDTNDAEDRRLRGSELCYGQVVQLRHINTHQYLTTSQAVARCEKANFRVELDHVGDTGLKAHLHTQCQQLLRDA